METAVISYRVADFLKKHPPFNAIDEADLLALSAGGRVRFYEPHEYLLWQDEPHRAQVFVIQQGTVSLWDDAGGAVKLRDVRGAGDLLGIERYNDAPRCAHSVRSESDVVIYSFPEQDFSQLVLKYPQAAEYVAADARVTPDYQAAAGRLDPQRTFLQSIVAERPLATARPTDSIAEVAAQVAGSRAHVVAVVGDAGRLCGVVTFEMMLAWVASGGGDSHREPLGRLLTPLPAVGPDTLVSDAIVAMSGSAVAAVAITADGATDGPLQAVVTAADLAPVFGDQPSAILHDIRLAHSVDELRALNQRARALTLDCLTSAGAVEWLTKATHLVDAAIVRRLLAQDGDDDPQDCWCFVGTSARRESLASVAPPLIVVLGGGSDPASARERHARLVSALARCGYLAGEQPFPLDFHVASVAEWRDRYAKWLSDPVIQQMYRARTLFDVRPVLGPVRLWRGVESAIADGADRDFLHVLANDCLASLPPLTFYEDAVVDTTGDHESLFRLDESVLQPLVDVGRVFGLAAGSGPGQSTLERLATARALLPEHEAIFREAADTLRIVLWQQGRVGISQGTSGAELPPALLSRNDRHVLKTGFRSIRRLLEFTAERSWLRDL